MKKYLLQLSLIFVLLSSIYMGFYHFQPDSRWSQKVKIPSVDAKDQKAKETDLLDGLIKECIKCYERNCQASNKIKSKFK